MDPKEQILWGSILFRCQVDRHPIKLKSKERKIQKLILDHLSEDYYNLPKNKRWESWYKWHEENN